MKSKGFENAILDMDQAIFGFISKLQKWENVKIMINISEHLRLVILPYIATFGLDPLINAEELLNRVRKLKDGWKLD